MAPCDENFYYSCNDCSRIFINQLTLQFHQKQHREDKLLAFVNRRRPAILIPDISLRIRKERTESKSQLKNRLKAGPARSQSKRLGAAKEQKKTEDRPFAVFGRGGGKSKISRTQWGMHKCFQCGIIFNKEINLRIHKQKRHNINPSICCNICGKKFLSKIRLQSHISSHPANLISSSRMPELEYNNGSDFNNSSASSVSQPPDLNPEGESSQTSNDTAEPEGDSYETCLTCGDAISGPDILIHISTHLQAGQTDCLHCEFQASHPKDLLDHMTVHYGLKTYACRLQNCGKAYHWKHSLARHIASSHPSANAFQCSSCDATFATLREERRHALTHVTDGEAMSTDTPTLMSEDGEPEKKKVGSYECEQCHAIFNKKKLLKAHESIHRRRSPEIQIQRPNFIGVRRVHQQTICSKPRRKKNNESSSVLIDSERRSCKTCGQEMMLSDLLVHIRTHVSKDQRQCELCQHVYANVESLREHMHTHYGLEPHKCTICHKTYSLKQSVLNHIIRNHKAAKPLEYYMCMIPATPKALKEAATVIVPKKSKTVKLNTNGIITYSPSSNGVSSSSMNSQSYGQSSAVSSAPSFGMAQHSNHSSLLNSRSNTPSTSSENGVAKKTNLKAINFQCNFCSRVFTTKFSVQRHEAKLHNYVEADHKRHYKTTYAVAEDSSDPMDSQSEMDQHSWHDGKFNSDTGSSYTNGDIHEHKYESLRSEIRSLLLLQDRCHAHEQYMFKEIPASLY